MAFCQIAEKRTLVIFLALLQISMIALFGKTFIESNSYQHRPAVSFKIVNTIDKSANLRNESLTKDSVVRSVGTMKSLETLVPQTSKSLETLAPKTSKSLETLVPQTSKSLETVVPQTSEFFTKIKSNSVYKHLDILDRGKRERVNLLLIVSSAPKRIDRRDAIRETWWPLCKSTAKVIVKCVFITDKQSKESKFAEQIKDESVKHNDLEFQDLGGGIEFGKRFLYHILWAVKNFEFDYFLRLDDDYFICVDKLLNELPMPPLPFFHWGWVHCINGITRPEESVILLSADVIKVFLSQDPEKMRCHPWADQMIALWVEDLGLREKLSYRTDRRLHHHPPARTMPHVLKENNICQKFLGLHGSYPDTMRTLWQNRGSYELKKETLIQNSDVCRSDLQFHWDAFVAVWRYEPKFCKTNPTWQTSKQGTGSSYGGREEGFGK